MEGKQWLRQKAEASLTTEVQEMWNLKKKFENGGIGLSSKKGRYEQNCTMAEETWTLWPFKNIESLNQSLLCQNMQAELQIALTNSWNFIRVG